MRNIDKADEIMLIEADEYVQNFLAGKMCWQDFYKQFGRLLRIQKMPSMPMVRKGVR